MGDPGANVRGPSALTSTSSDTGSGVATVTYQYSARGRNPGQSTSALWNTTALTDGLYDLHVVVTDNAGNSTVSATVADVRIDNTRADRDGDGPGANVRGTVALGSTSSDGGSGISGVVYQYSPAGQGIWTTTPSRRGTPPRSPTASTTCARSRPTTPAIRRRRQPFTNVRIDNTPPTTTSNAPSGAQSADVIVTLTSVSTRAPASRRRNTRSTAAPSRRARRSSSPRRPLTPTTASTPFSSSSTDNAGNVETTEVGQRHDRHDSARRNRRRPGIDAPRHGHR